MVPTPSPAAPDLVSVLAASIAADTVNLAPSAFGSQVDSTHPSSLPVFSSDPVGALRARAPSATSSSRPLFLLTDGYPHVLGQLSASLPAISNFPSVLNISALNGDYAPLDVFRSSSIPFFHSANGESAVKNALIASRVAVTLQTPVIHLMDPRPPSTSPDFDLNGLNYFKILPWISGHDFGSSYANGRVNGNGNLNETNGSGNLNGNGNANGHSVTPSDGTSTTGSPSVPEVIEQAYATLPTVLPQFSSAESFNSLIAAEDSKYIVLALCSTESLSPLLPHLKSRNISVLEISQYRPLDIAKLVSQVPQPVEAILTLDQSFNRAMRWSSLYLDILSAFNQLDSVSLPKIHSAAVGFVTEDNALQSANAIQKALTGDVTDTSNSVVIGQLPASPSTSLELRIPTHEQAYHKLLQQVLPSNLNIVNSPENVAPPSLQSTIPPTSPDFALGKVLAQTDARKKLEFAVRSLFTDAEAKAHLQNHPDLSSALSFWLNSPNDSFDDPSALKELSSLPRSVAAFDRVHELSKYFESFSSWIIGSDAWAYDLGNSGVHHALATNANINMLIIDTAPYDPDHGIDPDHRKKDIGLYAMNYGNAYVASVALYADYGQTVRALVEADRYNGPSIVLAYLPAGRDDSVQALQVLKQTKNAIDAGFWPLYRWDPSLEGTHRDVFQLDSIKIKADLAEFLDRQNHLTQLSLREPVFDEALDASPAKKIEKARDSRAKEAFEKLAGAISGPPLLVLFASDGGNAEKIAKRLGARAKARGLGARVMVFDNFSVEDLALEPNVVFVTSTAGQGEFPQNGRAFWKALAAKQPSAAGPTGGEGRYLDQVNYSVFALGDSHYWPRPEDAGYYNKPGKDLDKKIEQLGAERLTEIGLGNDQDADGPQTGYKEWEPRLWKALGVANVEIVEAEPEPITNEHIKIASNYLRGTITEGLQDTSTGALAESDGQLTKFHGIYQQDDRDIRDQRKDQGLEPAYMFMVRVRMPGGVCRPEQWLAVDEIAGKRGNETFKLTTRSTFQFHGIIKSNLKPAIQEINRCLLDTIAACGDVNRNVTCSANPSLGKLHADVYRYSKEISERLMPKTNAYAEVWLDKKKVAGDAVRNFSEPLYGPYYLPRKFKVGIAVPPSNDVDIFCNDVGLIAIVDEKTGGLQGFNISIGGGMGVTHAMKKTYPRLGSVIGFVSPEEASNVCEKVMLVQRDNGDRANRKQARLKYTIDRMTLPVFVSEVEKLLGYKLESAKSYHFDRNVDDFGWHVGPDGKHHYVAFIENGRVQDEPGQPFRTGLREIAKVHKGVFRLTANQHLVIADIPPEERPLIEKLIKDCHLDVLDQSGLRKSSSACVAFPTCGLAMAESERYLPILIDKIEAICEEAGLRNDAIVMRMTGCPNGCARPYAAEVAFVGKAPGQYLMLLGGGFYGQRLCKIYKESVDEEQIISFMKPMIQRYAKEREPDEKFGDWTIRAGYISAVESGAKWYEGMAPGDQIA